MRPSDPSNPTPTQGVSTPVPPPGEAERRARDPHPDTGDLTLQALSHDLPEFATVMRGYDRGQVEDYVTRLQEFLHDAEQRAAHADRRLAQTQRKIADLERELARAADLATTSGAAYDQLGERISTILRLAAEEADSIRSGARNEAESIVEEAQREADQSRIAAEHALTELSRRRDGVVAELNRVRDILTTLGLSGEEERGEPDVLQDAASKTEAVPAPKDPNVVIDLVDRQAARTT